MSRHKSTTATISSVLVFYDGPQLLLLKNQDNEYLLGHAIEYPGFAYPIFCCQMLPRHLNRYLLGKVDLRFVFEATPKNRMYFTDLGAKQKPLKMRQAKASEINAFTLPEPGIFSTVHTHPLEGFALEDDDRQRFSIDGVWEARDFSQFHGKMADTYSLLYIAQKLDFNGTSTQEAKFLRDSIVERPWQGGGSYLSFYGGLKSEPQSLHPLRVAGIEYHSPGYMELAGKREVLDEVTAAINTIIANGDDIARTYNAIRKALRAEDLLAASKEKQFSNPGVEDYVKRQSIRLSSQSSLPNPHLIWESCDRNTVVFAKLVLSYCRRLRALANFVVEGRVKIA